MSPAPGSIKTALLPILLAISIFIANIEFLPRLLLSGSLLTETNIQNFSIGAALLILMSNSIVLRRVLILLGRANLFSVLILIQSIIQVLGLYIYNHEVNITQLISIILYVGPGVALSFIFLIILAMKLIPKRESLPLDKKSFLKNCSSFFILEAMTALLVSIDYFFLSQLTFFSTLYLNNATEIDLILYWDWKRILKELVIILINQKLPLDLEGFLVKDT